MIKAIIFDFDGVLVESVDIKTDAFRKLFENFTDKAKEIVKFHIDNGGMSRFDKFRHIYAHILKKPLSKKEFDRLCADFSELVVEKVTSAPFVRGAPEFLRNNANKYSMFVVSATPEKEINEIVKRRKLDKYFLEVYGSPRKKAELLRHILDDNNYSKDEAIFLGDSINDYMAAKSAKVLFAARVRDGKKTDALAGVKTKFKDLFEFEKYLISRCKE